MPLVSLQAAFVIMTRKEKYHKVLEYFQSHAPDPETELQYTNPYELLVAVILSAQCTDKRVNMVTPELFRKYPTVEHLATAHAEEIFLLIKSISYPNNKAKHLAGMAKMLLDQFNGQVPSSVDELVRLPGVGRKTANVIASVIFNQPAMAVDTHVFRVAARLGLTTKAKTPLAAEKQLVKYIPEELIPLAHHWLILHGRYTCLARTPKCQNCGLVELCSFSSKTKRLYKQ
jgi:endonuclease-3